MAGGVLEPADVADAVIVARFQTSELMAGAAEMLCYGTAVSLEAVE